MLRRHIIVLPSGFITRRNQRFRQRINPNRLNIRSLTLTAVPMYHSHGLARFCVGLDIVWSVLASDKPTYFLEKLEVALTEINIRTERHNLEIAAIILWRVSPSVSGSFCLSGTKACIFLAHLYDDHGVLVVFDEFFGARTQNATWRKPGRNFAVHRRCLSELSIALRGNLRARRRKFDERLKSNREFQATGSFTWSIWHWVVLNGESESTL